MTDSITRRGWDRDRNARRSRRHELRAGAAALLSAYLDAVTDALLGYGWRVAHRAVTSTRALEAELTLRPGDPTTADPDATGRPVLVRRDEDTGWCVSQHLLGTHTPALHHYLPTELVPAPTQVARFVDGVLAPTRDPYDPGYTWMGMPYPTLFRYRSQPLGPVLEDLQRAVATTHDAPRHAGPRT